MLAASSPTLASLAACHSCWVAALDFVAFRLQLCHGLLQMLLALVENLLGSFALGDVAPISTPR